MIDDALIVGGRIAVVEVHFGLAADSGRPSQVLWRQMSDGDERPHLNVLAVVERGTRTLSLAWAMKLHTLRFAGGDAPEATKQELDVTEFACNGQP